MKIDDLKVINKYQTSEEMFGIDSPPDYQCPLIDEIIKAIKEIEHNARVGRYDEFEDLKDKLENIDYHIYDLESKLEELRENIDRLRSWGIAWKKLAKEFAENGFDPEEYGLVTKKEEFV
jgi:predicted  nucleic acid-binding Zn-ribbon protein